jgi:hypothetical protein
VGVGLDGMVGKGVNVFVGVRVGVREGDDEGVIVAVWVAAGSVETGTAGSGGAQAARREIKKKMVTSRTANGVLCIMDNPFMSNLDTVLYPGFHILTSEENYKGEKSIPLIPPSLHRQGMCNELTCSGITRMRLRLSAIIFLRQQLRRQTMKARQITPNVDWVGAVDWERGLFDALIPLPDRTSYTSTGWARWTGSAACSTPSSRCPTAPATTLT